MAFDPVKMKRVLNSFGASVVAKAKENLNEPRGSYGNKISTSGNLESKIKFAAKVMPNSMSLKFDLGEYGQGIDQGVQGWDGGGYYGSRTDFKFKDIWPSRRMVDNIQSWIVQKNVKTYGELRSAAFGIAWHVLKNGLHSTHFFRNAYEDNFENLDKELVEAFGLDVDDFFKFIFKK